MANRKTAPKFRTHYNIVELPQDYEPEPGESLTVPHQSYTIDDLIERSARGIPVATMVAVRKGLYEDPGEDALEEEDPTLDPAFSMEDAFELGEDIAEEVAEARQELDKDSDENDKAQNDDDPNDDDSANDEKSE